MRKFALTAALLIAALALTACSDNQDSAANTTAAVDNRKTMPDDPDLASLYTQSCFACHGTGAGGAPRTAVSADWQPRMDKGMDVLLDHTINGFNGMPPLGMCMDCGEAEFEALIRFMAGEQEQ